MHLGEQSVSSTAPASRAARHRWVVLVGGVLGLGLALLAGAAAAPPAWAHEGIVPPEPPGLRNLVTGWSADPLVWIPAVIALGLWWVAVRRVDRQHPANPVPRVRTWSWITGVIVILVALDSGIERYDTTLFWIHMVQHILLAFVAPLFLLYAGPITLLLRASSPESRRRWIFPVLRSRVARFLGFPVVAWLLFAIVMWGSHFSPLFEAALEDEGVHAVEHALFLFSALLFWRPVVGPDPAPWRLSPAVKVLYVGLQMPLTTFLALAIYMAGEPLYDHYLTNLRAWGPTPLADQQLAGGLMWISGDLIFITVLVLLVLVWMRDDERRAGIEDRRLDAEAAAARGRATTSAGPRAAVAGSGPPGEAPRS